MLPMWAMLPIMTDRRGCRWRCANPPSGLRQRERRVQERLIAGQERGMLPEDSDFDGSVADLEAERMATGASIVGNEVEMIAHLVDAFDERRRAKSHQRSLHVLQREQRLLRDGVG